MAVIPDEPPAPENPKQTDRTSRLFHVSEFLQPPHQNWVIRKYLQPGTINLLFGALGCGKSLVALDMAASVATGRPWVGHKTKQSTVCYIAGEGFGEA